MSEISDLLSRVKNLEDIEAIRQLQYEYCRHMDEGFRLPELANLWAEDAVWDAGSFGKYEGKKAIADYFKRHALEVASASHYMSNPEIKLAGDEATCRCLGLVPASLLTGDGAQNDIWIFVTWNNRFTRSGEKWLFQSLTATVNNTWSHIKPNT